MALGAGHCYENMCHSLCTLVELSEILVVQDREDKLLVLVEILQRMKARALE